MPSKSGTGSSVKPVQVEPERLRKKGFVCMYVFILQQDNTQNIKPEGQQGSEALTAARNKKCLEQILATTDEFQVWNERLRE